MSIENLFLYFNNYVSLNEIEKQALSERITVKKIKRKQYILQENDVCHFYSFVVSGLFKMYTTDKNDVEHNLQFAPENHWITDLGSLHGHKPSAMNIEAIEDSVIIQIEKSDMHYLLSTFPKFERNFRVIIENKFIELEARVLENISASAEEKYLSFQENYPQLFNRLPNTQIASYLGITPEFLSKVRNNISKK